MRRPMDAMDRVGSPSRMGRDAALGVETWNLKKVCSWLAFRANQQGEPTAIVPEARARLTGERLPALGSRSGRCCATSLLVFARNDRPMAAVGRNLLSLGLAEAREPRRSCVRIRMKTPRLLPAHSLLPMRKTSGGRPSGSDPASADRHFRRSPRPATA